MPLIMCWFCGEREPTTVTAEGHQICGHCIAELAATNVPVTVL